MCAMKSVFVLFARTASRLFISIIFVLKELPEAIVFERASKIEEIFVAAAGKRRDDYGIFRHIWRDLSHFGERVRAFERGNHALKFREIVGCGDGLIVGGIRELYSFLFVQVGEVGAYTGVVEAGRYRMSGCYLAILGLQKE